ncbi:MAG: enoyl-CoA hydratase/isomerase family protein [Acidimicrobiales bacterium]|nr:enoyl-CoA hydratase/isomerase family protein [Acidimicrobiales bacterium]
MGDYETLELILEGPVAWLIFDRAGDGNAIDARMFVELEDAWGRLEIDEDVRVIVNTGNGRSFQTGLDVRQLASNPEALRASSRQTRDFQLRMTGWHCGVTKPIIAAVNGTCAGGGLHFVADADVVIAADTASFVDPHVSVGQVSAFETIGLLKKAPMGVVARMALMGRHERVDADRARQLGIVSEVVPADRLRARAGELAATIAQQDPGTLRALKQSLWNALEVQ